MRLGVAGVGLIGGSIAVRATACGMHVTGYDRDPDALAYAREYGMVAATVATFDELVASADILALCGPLDATLEQLAWLQARRAVDITAIVDVASVKEPVAQAGRGLVQFVPSHPIAGSERSGPEHARADLFDGRVWTLDADADPAAREIVRTFVETLGARPFVIGSAEHDRTIALTSHLPQLLSVALGARLAERLDEPGTLELCGTGMRSLLRLAGSSWPLWRAVFGANSVALAQEVRALADVLIGAAESLETQSVDALGPRFTTAAAAVARLGDSAIAHKGES
jgi:prephenate dehydrogenase